MSAVAMPEGAPAAPRAAAAIAPETPLFFASGDRPLYGVHHAPPAPRRDAPVLVHCHSLGVEQLTVYRAEVLLARAAAERGFPVFRWHARGHGDSAGDFADVTLERMTEDALAAAAEARRRSGASRVAWLGVRFGALVAARAALATPGSAALALWEPVHHGHDYFRAHLRAWLFSEVAAGRRPGVTADELLERVMREGAVDVHGYELHRAIVASAREETLARRLEGWKAPTLIAQIQARPRLSAANEALGLALRDRGAAVTTVAVAEEPGWSFISNPAWECAPLVDRTVEWLDALA
jgi:pimeloyl-ACP methyl ester carboxylesterase